MTPFATITLIEDPRGFATLWLNRPEKHNAFNAQMIRELIPVSYTHLTLPTKA